MLSPHRVNTTLLGLNFILSFGPRNSWHQPDKGSICKKNVFWLFWSTWPSLFPVTCPSTKNVRFCRWQKWCKINFCGDCDLVWPRVVDPPLGPFIISQHPQFPSIPNPHPGHYDHFNHRHCLDFYISTEKLPRYANIKRFFFIKIPKKKYQNKKSKYRRRNKTKAALGWSAALGWEEAICDILTL